MLNSEIPLGADNQFSHIDIYNEVLLVNRFLFGQSRCGFATCYWLVCLEP